MQVETGQGPTQDNTQTWLRVLDRCASKADYTLCSGDFADIAAILRRALFERDAAAARAEAAEREASDARMEMNRIFNRSRDRKNELVKERDAEVQAERAGCREAVWLALRTPSRSALMDAMTAIDARGPTTALTAALAQARREVWEKAAVIAETLRDGNPSAIAGTAWWGTKIAAAIRSAAAGEEGK